MSYKEGSSESQGSIISPTSGIALSTIQILVLSSIA